MKKRKIKLISSFASLVMVCAVLTVGVWAVATQSVNVQTTVTFTATGVSGTILGTLEGLDKTTYYYNTTMAAAGEAITFSPKTDALGDWILGEETALKIDNTEDGLAESLVYSFTITNASTTDGMNATISTITAGTNLALTSVTQDGTTLSETDGAYAATLIPAEGSSTIVVTFDVEDASSSITTADINFNVALKSPNLT